jgi:sensor histidine kinase YesM
LNTIQRKAGEILVERTQKEHWSRTSIRLKIMVWVVAILIMMAACVGLAVAALQALIADYETLSIDNNKCHEVQQAIEQEQNIFLDLIRERSQRNQERFAKACARTERSIRDLPTRFSAIGEDRFARTWSLSNGYRGYTRHRDALLAMDPQDPDYASELYRVIAMQDDLSVYSLRLIQETMEYDNQFYRSQKEFLDWLPTVLIALSAAALIAVLGILRLLSSMVVRPILLLAEESRRISANDFSSPDLPVRTHDEIGLLIGSFNRMKHAMIDYIAAREALHRQEVERLEMEKNLEQTRLEMLKSQVNPHFLFNTLNMISCMARLEDAETTDLMIVSLGNLFRYNLRTKEQEVHLLRELEALDYYMYIQQMRHDGRVTCKKDIRVDPLSVRVPSFTLQPIVENALTHGMKSKEDCGRVLLKIWQEENMLIISVADNGRGMNEEEYTQLHQKMLDSEKTGRGIGLGNIFRRIGALYPDGGMKIYSRENSGTIIQLFIPQNQEETKS